MQIPISPVAKLFCWSCIIAYAISLFLPGFYGTEFDLSLFQNYEPRYVTYYVIAIQVSKLIVGIAGTISLQFISMALAPITEHAGQGGLPYDPRMLFAMYSGIANLSVVLLLWSLLKGRLWRVRTKILCSIFVLLPWFEIYDFERMQQLFSRRPAEHLLFGYYVFCVAITLVTISLWLLPSHPGGPGLARNDRRRRLYTDPFWNTLFGVVSFGIYWAFYLAWWSHAHQKFWRNMGNLGKTSGHVREPSRRGVIFGGAAGFFGLFSIFLMFYLHSVDISGLALPRVEIEQYVLLPIVLTYLLSFLTTWAIVILNIRKVITATGIKPNSKLLLGGKIRLSIAFFFTALFSPAHLLWLMVFPPLGASVLNEYVQAIPIENGTA